MSLPSFVPFPPAHVLKRLLPEELEAILASWNLLAHGYLLLPKDAFAHKAMEESSLTEFLVSYMHENVVMIDDPTKTTPKARALRSSVFLLVHRTFMELAPIPPKLLDILYLEELSVLYCYNSRLSELFAKLSELLKRGQTYPSLIERGASVIRALDANSKKPESEVDDLLLRTVAFLSVSYLYGQILMLGSDFIDSLNAAYMQADSGLRKKILAIAYLCFTSLLLPIEQWLSILIDHLYGLKSSSSEGSLLQALCSSTPFLEKFRQSLSGLEAPRAQSLLEQLSSFEKKVNEKTKKRVKRKVHKSKPTIREHIGHGTFKRIDEDKFSLIFQVLDLFPDLGTAFIADLLEEYDDDIEQVTAHLLDDSLPAHLQKADRTVNL